MANARTPYTGVAFSDKTRTVIASAHAPQQTRGELSQLPLLYSVAYSVDSAVEKDLMVQRLGIFRQGLQINGR